MVIAQRGRLVSVGFHKVVPYVFCCQWTQGNKKGVYLQKISTMANRLFRSQEKVLGGVCGGIAEYLGMDPTVVRIIFLLLSLFGFGTGILVYVILWIIMPG